MSALLFVLVVAMLASSAAFITPARRLIKLAPSASVPLEILGRDIQVADSVKAKIEAKIGKALEKLAQDAKSCTITLKVVKNPDTETHTSMRKDSHIGEASVFMKRGGVVRVSEASDNMETAVDLLSHTLTESLKRYKEKKTGKYSAGPGTKALAAAADETD